MASLTCLCCGRELTDPISQTRGVGPECSSRLAALRRAERRQVREGAALPLEYESTPDSSPPTVPNPSQQQYVKPTTTIPTH